MYGGGGTFLLVVNNIVWHCSDIPTFEPSKSGKFPGHYADYGQKFASKGPLSYIMPQPIDIMPALESLYFTSYNPQYLLMYIYRWRMFKFSQIHSMRIKVILIDVKIGVCLDQLQTPNL